MADRADHPANRRAPQRRGGQDPMSDDEKARVTEDPATVDRMAKAILAGHWPTYPWERSEWAREHHRDLARAALAAALMKAPGDPEGDLVAQANAAVERERLANIRIDKALLACDAWEMHHLDGDEVISVT